MRIFTCTPVEFGGGADFFARDSGLLCRGFQSLGIESRAVMPGGRKPEDEEDLIRTDFKNLESAEWWQSQQLDGVVLYAWGRPKFRKVAAAIHEADIFLVLNQDNGGLVSPLAGFGNWMREQYVLSGQGKVPTAWLSFIKLVFRGLSMGLLVTDPLRAFHLSSGDVIACVSPRAAEHYAKLCRVYGGEKLAKRVAVIPHAVESRFRYDGRRKQRRIACLGRWEDEVQKRPRLLMHVVSALLEQDHKVDFVIMGKSTPALEGWHRALPPDARSRVKIAGKVGRDELAEGFRDSMMFYSPSAFESFGIAAAEALCSGCSVVAGRSVSMAAFEWFVSEGSGTLSDQNTVKGDVDALKAEMAAWDNGARDASMISSIWSERLHADNVARAVVELLEKWRKAQRLERVVQSR